MPTHVHIHATRGREDSNGWRGGEETTEEENEERGWAVTTIGRKGGGRMMEAEKGGRTEAAGVKGVTSKVGSGKKMVF
jgi:hypothetical protein